MGISIKNISFQYKNTNAPVIDGLSLEIKRGESIAISGVSGSGKSTLLNLITSFYEPIKGSIDFIGIDKTDISYIRQSSMDMLFPWLTVKENLEFALKERGLLNEERKTKLVSLVKKLGLYDKMIHKTYPHQLSGGEKKRLSFACGLSYSPKIILLDEAFTGIDFALKWELWSFLKTEVIENNITMILVTHDFDEAVLLADRIVFINKDKKIDKEEILATNKDYSDIEKSLSNELFIETKRQTLKIYKRINE